MPLLVHRTMTNYELVPYSILAIPRKRRHRESLFLSTSLRVPMTALSPAPRSPLPESSSSLALLSSILFSFFFPSIPHSSAASSVSRVGIRRNRSDARDSSCLEHGLCHVIFLLRGGFGIVEITFFFKTWFISWIVIMIINIDAVPNRNRCTRKDKKNVTINWIEFYVAFIV